ncbi:MAG: hypothetical protein ACI3ZQ_06010 [Candidatus Cryptobacteroides sp.]
MAEYIERGALKAKLALFCSENCSKCTDIDCAECILTNIINTSIAADVAPVVHGKWLRASHDDQYEGEYYCSVCNAEEFYPQNAPFAPFCWHCGAKMDEEDKT